MSEKLKIGIIGIGMVGTPLMEWLTENRGYKRGVDLFCYDIDSRKSCEDDVNLADVIFICVPTPPNPDGSCNTSIVRTAIRMIEGPKTVVIKSTVPPRTTEIFQIRYPDKKFIFYPEFLTESQAGADFIHPDRQILGVTSKSLGETGEILLQLPLALFTRPWSPIYGSKKVLNATEAELVKYASNVFGYIKVIFGNMLADIVYGLNLSGTVGKVEYDNVKECLGADPRIGSSWLDVEHGDYCGAGGFCFPKDMNAFIAFVEILTAEMEIAGIRGLVIERMLYVADILKLVRNYNSSLLSSQNLTEEEVSIHNHELVLKKRTKIRQS